MGQRLCERRAANLPEDMETPVQHDDEDDDGEDDDEKDVNLRLQ